MLQPNEMQLLPTHTGTSSSSIPCYQSGLGNRLCYKITFNDYDRVILSPGSPEGRLGKQILKLFIMILQQTRPCSDTPLVLYIMKPLTVYSALITRGVTTSCFTKKSQSSCSSPLLSAVKFHLTCIKIKAYSISCKHVKVLVK